MLSRLERKILLLISCSFIMSISLVSQMRQYSSSKDTRFRRHAANETLIEYTSYTEETILIFPKVKTNISLLVLVCSSPHDQKHSDLRTAIRQTWGKQIKSNPNAMLVFLTAKTKSMNSLTQESNVNGDLLVFDYIDTYRTITRKLISTFRWASENIKPSYILKTDDDVYINVLKLLTNLLPSIKSPFYVGLPHQTDPTREETDEHYVTYQQYPYELYPHYNIGLFYLLSGDILPEMLKMVESTPIFSVDDAYVGVLVNKVNVIVTKESGFIHTKHIRFFIELFTDCMLTTVFGIGDSLTPVDLHRLHQRFEIIHVKPPWCWDLRMLKTWFLS